VQKTVKKELTEQEYNLKKVRYISHEIRNQLSICDLYTEIIKKYCEKNNISDATLLKSAECIKRAVKMAGNSLLELKSSDNTEFKKYNITALVSEALNLSNVYALNKNIKFDINFKNDCEVIADKNKFEAVIINLVKNACEAFDDEQSEKNISVMIYEEKGFVKIIVSNNAKPVQNPETIFNDGYTTKQTGSGLGLYICKKSIEEISGRLELIKSDNISTEFMITLGVV